MIKLNIKHRDFPYIPFPHIYTNCPLSRSRATVVYLLQLMNLQSPQFTLGFTFGAVHSMSLNTCMTEIHYCSITWNGLTSVKVPCTLPFHPSLPSSPNPWKSLIFLLSLYFYLLQIVTQLESFSFVHFQTGIFHLVICIKFPLSLCMA